MSNEKKPYRPSWDDYFMAITKLIASRGTCDRLYSGAILVKDNRIISSGYNGSPAGLPHCNDVGHLMEEGHCVRTIHGEHNALLQAAKSGGISTEGATMYTKYSPCIHCTKYVIGCGIVRVIMARVYRNEAALKMLEGAGIKVDVYKENEKWNNEVKNTFSENVEIRVNEGEVKLNTKK